MKRIVDVSKLTKTEWLTERRKGIGGSDAAAILSIGKWKGPIDVWAEKTSNVPPEEHQSEAMWRGTVMEQAVADRFCETTGKKARRNNFMMAHDEYSWMIADVDREIVGENALLECKTASPYVAWKWEGDNIPPEYVIQCLHYMAVTGAEKVYLACAIIDTGFVIREIERDEDAIETLIQAEKDFWEGYVLTGTMPPPDGSKASEKVINERYAYSDEDVEEVNLSNDIDFERYDTVKALIDDLSKEKAEIEQRIKIEMEPAERARKGAYFVSWKTTKPRESIDTKKLREEQPEIYEKYLKQGNLTRRFTVKREEE